MKQKIKLLFLLILLPQAVLLAETDSLLLVPHSRIHYCNFKVEQVALLTEESLAKDSKIIILDNRLDNKDREVASLNRSLIIRDSQLSTSKAETQEVRQQVTFLKDENKQLRKKGGIKSIGLVVLTVLCVAFGIN